MNTYYEIRYPVYNNRREKDPDGKKHWLRIGSATGLESGQILCTIEAVPLNWNGELHLFPFKETE